MQLAALLPALTARLNEPTSRVSLVFLVLTAGAALGLYTTDQLDNLVTQAVLVLTAAGQLAGILTKEKGAAPEAAVELALGMAEQAAAKAVSGDEAAKIRDAAKTVADALGGVRF
jgi:hypothetical protein